MISIQIEMIKAKRTSLKEKISSKRKRKKKITKARETTITEQCTISNDA